MSEAKNESKVDQPDGDRFEVVRGERGVDYLATTLPIGPDSDVTAVMRVAELRVQGWKKARTDAGRDMETVFRATPLPGHSPKHESPYMLFFYVEIPRGEGSYHVIGPANELAEYLLSEIE